MPSPCEVMDYTGWWCEECGLTKCNRDGKCTQCEGEVTIVPTKILTEQAYEGLEEEITELKSSEWRK